MANPRGNPALLAGSCGVMVQGRSSECSNESGSVQRDRDRATGRERERQRDRETEREREREVRENRTKAGFLCKTSPAMIFGATKDGHDDWRAWPFEWGFGVSFF